MSRAIPIFRKENLSYLREEKEGYWTFVSKIHPETRDLIINPTAKEILDLCDGTKALEEIENEMKNRYPMVEEKRLKMDIAKTIASFSRLGIIEWEGDNPFLYRCKEPLNEDFALMIGQENDILKIERFIKLSPIYQSSADNEQKLLCYRSPYFRDLDYEPLILRQKLFAYIEEFFLLLRRAEIIGLLSIELPLLQNTTAATIKLIISPKDWFANLLRYAYDNFPVLAVREITKIRILELLKDSLDLELKEILFKEGFVEEGFSKNEFGFGGDVKILARCYEPKFIERINKIKMKGGDKNVSDLSIPNH
jgi:hypothetical protein